MSRAVTSDAGNANLKPLGIADEALHVELVPRVELFAGKGATRRVSFETQDADAIKAITAAFIVGKL